MGNKYLKRIFSLPIKMEEEIPLLFKRYHLIFMMIAIFIPLWGFFLKFLLPKLYDPLSVRFIVAGIAIFSDIISRKFNFSYPIRYALIMFNLFILNVVLLWVTGLNDNHVMYVIGVYLTFVGTGMLFDDEKSLIMFVLSLIVPLIVFNGLVKESALPVGFIYLLFASGSIINYLGLKDRFQLITKLRSLNDELKHKSIELDQQRLDTFNASKLASLGEMAGNIAHEMNNPLAIIQGFARKLKRSVLEDRVETKDDTAKSLSIIIETTNRMALIIYKL